MSQVKHYEMKDSGVEWIGNTPRGWRLVSAKFFMKVQAGYPFDSERFDNSQGMPLIRIRDITSGRAETFYNGDYPKEYVVHNNDLLVGMDGDFNVRWWQGDEAVLNQRCCRIFARKGLRLRYFYYILPFYLKQVNELAYSTTVKHLANSDIGNADICLPPEDEQAAITAFLDEKCSTIDAIVSEAKATIEEYKAWKASVIFEAVTKGLNPNAEMKDSGVEWIGRIPKGWNVRKIKSLCKLKTGTTPETSHLEWFNGSVMWFTPSDFSDHYILKTSLRTLSELAISDKAAVKIPKDSVLLVGIGATAGKVGYTPFECSINQQITALIPFSISSRYLMYYLISNAKTIRELANYTTLPIINNATLGNFVIILPPLPEQTDIAAYLDEKCAAIDGVIAEKEALITELETYKKSLIFETVTGKRRVC